MISFYVTFFLLSILIAYGVLEYQIHQRYVKSIPVRIHVNGTRGKSSVTRLIGPGLDDVGRALCGTIPKNSKIFTSEDRRLDMFEAVAKKRNTQIHQALASTISDEDMLGFTYIEHKENVSLALDICAELGVDRALALAEMKKTIPDEGVLTKVTVNYDDKRIDFYNAFAANDPESSLMIWNSIVKHVDADEHLIILLNTRKDRQDRAKQLIELIALKLNYSSVALIGDVVDLVVEMGLKQKINKEDIVPIGSKPTEDVYIDLCNAAKKKTTIVGIGNMGAGGSELVKYFESKQVK